MCLCPEEARLRARLDDMLMVASRLNGIWKSGGHISRDAKPARRLMAIFRKESALAAQPQQPAKGAERCVYDSTVDYCVETINYGPVSLERCPVHGRPADGDTRFWSKVDKKGPNECWHWLGAINKNNRDAGYGRFYNSATRKICSAHRYSYELNSGPIPNGMTVDHICRNRACVNPAHLEVVTGRENILRGTSFSAREAKQTHCKRGHPLSGDNIYRQPKRPTKRTCRACQSIRRPKPTPAKAGKAQPARTDVHSCYEGHCSPSPKPKRGKKVR